METRRRSCIAIQIGLAAEHEQRRRLLHPSDERLRKAGCYTIARMITEQAPTHRLRHAATPMVKARPAPTGPLYIRRGSKTHTASGWPLLRNAVRAVTEAGAATAQGASNLASAATHAVSDVASGLSHATAQAVNATANAASATANAATAAGSRAVHAAEDYFFHAISSGQRIFLRGQEEIERVRRITSEEEHWAMLNAFAAARCMRENFLLKNPDRYVPFSGRISEAYWAKLLEQCEMRRRCSYPMPAQKNAKKLVSMLANTRFNPHSTLCLPSLRYQLPVAPAERDAIKIAPIENRPYVPAGGAPYVAPLPYTAPLETRNVAPLPSFHAPLESRMYTPTLSSLSQGQLGSSTGSLGSSGSYQFTMPPLDLANIPGKDKVVIFYPVFAQPVASPLLASQPSLVQPAAFPAYSTMPAGYPLASAPLASAPLNAAVQDAAIAVDNTLNAAVAAKDRAVATATTAANDVANKATNVANAATDLAYVAKDKAVEKVEASKDALANAADTAIHAASDAILAAEHAAFAAKDAVVHGAQQAAHIPMAAAAAAKEAVVSGAHMAAAGVEKAAAWAADATSVAAVSAAEVAAKAADYSQDAALDMKYRSALNQRAAHEHRLAAEQAAAPAVQTLELAAAKAASTASAVASGAAHPVAATKEALEEARFRDLDTRTASAAELHAFAEYRAAAEYRKAMEDRAAIVAKEADEKLHQAQALRVAAAGPYRPAM